MTKLLSYLDNTVISESTSPIQYKRAGFRQRYLTLNGEEIANTGIDCETCLFLVQVSGAKWKNPKNISRNLNDGITELSHDFVTDLSCIIPNGRYVVALLSVYPRFKRQADGSEYYRVGSRQFAYGKKVEEYLVPIQPTETLDQSVIQEYIKSIETKSTLPTTLSVSFLDSKYPLNDLNFNEIWLHTHYLLDGHHKMFAAAKAKKPVTMISFVSIDESFAKSEQIEKLIQLLI